MKRLLCVSAVLVAACHQPLPSPPSETNVVNGEEISEAEYPSVVKIDVGCTATFIGKRTLLTAAHCVKSSVSYRGITAAETFYNIKFPIGEKTAQDPNIINDLAIAVFSQDIAPAVSQLSSSSPAIGAAVTLVGYGCSDLDTAQGTGIKRKGLNKIGAISGGIISLFPGQDSAGKPLATGCPGDSGGPLFNSSGEIIGVVSAGDNSVSKYVDLRSPVSHRFLGQVLATGTAEIPAHIPEVAGTDLLGRDSLAQELTKKIYSGLESFVSSKGSDLATAHNSVTNGGAGNFLVMPFGMQIASGLQDDHRLRNTTVNSPFYAIQFGSFRQQNWSYEFVGIAKSRWAKEGRDLEATTNGLSGDALAGALLQDGYYAGVIFGEIIVNADKSVQVKMVLHGKDKSKTVICTVNDGTCGKNTPVPQTPSSGGQKPGTPIGGSTPTSTDGFPKPQWISAVNGGVPAGALSLGSFNGVQAAVCRASFQNEYMPGSLVQGEGCYATWQGKLLKATSYEVLTVNGSAQAVFAYAAGANGSIPAGAWQAGSNGGSPLFLCAGNGVFGRIGSGYNGCFVWNGTQEVSLQQYSVLVLR